MVRSAGVALCLGLMACGGGANSDADADGLTREQEEGLGLDPEVADTDGDGLDDGDEVSGGSDPLLPDTDSDGLLDGEEITHGSDPLLVDTDEDTYSDFDEVQEGHDPADKKDRIYKGYWPYNPTKDELGDPASTGAELSVGDKFFRVKEKDQFGDVVDLYDFAGAGKLIVIDASATWCPPCMETATWLSTGVGSYEATFSAVRLAVDAGDVRWITFMTDDDQRFDGTQVEDVKAWDELFPHEMVPVLVDPDSSVLTAVNLDGTSLAWPTYVVLNNKMKVVYKGGTGDTLAYVQGEL
jgi:hypothetical protein